MKQPPKPGDVVTSYGYDSHKNLTLDPDGNGSMLNAQMA
jgi:hypothetical protein